MRNAAPPQSRVIEPDDQVERELDIRDVDYDFSADIHDLGIDAGDLFEQAIEQTRMAICISDPRQPDCPIIVVNQAFVELTGYPREEIVGRNCRFLQGPETAPADVQKIRDAMEAEDVRVIEILNYKKDGTPFWNSLHIGPIFDKNGRMTHFYGSQWDVTDVVEERQKRRLEERIAAELRHRTRNLFSAVAAIVRMTARGETDAAVLATKIGERMSALGRAHEMSLPAEGTSTDTADLQQLVEALMKPYGVSGQDRIEMSGPSIELDGDQITPIGLALHELATNALKYGALAEDDGRLRVTWEITDEELRINWIETVVTPLAISPAPAGPQGGVGSQLIEGVIGGMGGSVERDWKATGLHATVILPRPHGS